MDHRLTWKQFKDAVEAKGVTDDFRICYINFDGETEPAVEKPEPDSFLYVYVGRYSFLVKRRRSLEPSDRD